MCINFLLMVAKIRFKGFVCFFGRSHVVFHCLKFKFGQESPVTAKAVGTVVIMLPCKLYLVVQLLSFFCSYNMIGGCYSIK